MRDSLLYRLFKARYFPNSKFLQASIGNNPSYAWRSIMAAQYLVQQGTRWSVGNGNSIHVWGDKLLPTSSTYKVVSPRQILHANTRVSELISQDSGAWKHQVLDVIFLPHEAELIKSIPLSAQLPEDKLIWAGNNNGKFSVKSAYRLAMEGARFDSGSSSDNGILRRFWRFVWRIPVPHKVRHFAWRACRNILPTKENLMCRKILQDDWCEECKAEAGTTGHLFWRCS